MAEWREGQVQRRNPWLRIWLEPRETIRSVMNTDNKRQFFLLVFIYGLPLALNFIQSFAIASFVPFWAMLLGAALISPFLGLAGIYITSWLLELTGRWLQGRGSLTQIRTAVAWSNVPSLVTIGIWGVLLGVFGRQIFDRDFALIQFTGYQAGILFLAMLVEMLISLWGFILLLNTLAEVQGFSMGRAFFNIMIPFIGVVALIWFLGWALGGG